jgi:hypothetical protein
MSCEWKGMFQMKSSNTIVFIEISKACKTKQHITKRKIISKLVHCLSITVQKWGQSSNNHLLSLPISRGHELAQGREGCGLQCWGPPLEVQRLGYGFIWILTHVSGAWFWFLPVACRESQHLVFPSGVFTNGSWVPRARILREKVRQKLHLFMN